IVNVTLDKVDHSQRTSSRPDHEMRFPNFNFREREINRRLRTFESIVRNVSSDADDFLDAWLPQPPRIQPQAFANGIGVCKVGSCQGLVDNRDMSSTAHIPLLKLSSLHQRDSQRAKIARLCNNDSRPLPLIRRNRLAFDFEKRSGVADNRTAAVG